MECSSRSEFSNRFHQAYTISKNNGWLDEWMPSKMHCWTYETCLEIAKNCNGRHHFEKTNSGAYQYSRKMGWLDDFFPKKNIYKECERAAMDCKTKTEFQKRYSTLYNAARTNNWLDKWFYNKKRTYERCYSEAQKYDTLKDFREKAYGPYQKSVKEGWLNDFTWLKRQELHIENDWLIYAYEDRENKAVYVGLTYDLKMRDYQHRTNHCGNDTVYNYFSISMPKPNIKMDMLSGDDASYYEKWYSNAYKKTGWRVLNKRGCGARGGGYKWTYETAYDEARKYNSRGKLRLKAAGLYYRAKKEGWLDDYYWMTHKWTKESAEKKRVIMKSLEGKIIKEYESIYAAAKDNNYLRTSIKRCCHGRIPTAYGFKWEFAA